MQYGKLNFTEVENSPHLLATPTKDATTANKLGEVLVSEIDPSLADTAAFCEQYDIGLEVSANCVIVKAKRGEKVTYAAIMILATDQADVNNVIRRTLDARKISFAPMDEATSLTSMEFGGINPIGLPPDWPILVDTKVANLDRAIIGSGLRKSKILTTGQVIATLPNTQVLPLAK